MGHGIHDFLATLTKGPERTTSGEERFVIARGFGGLSQSWPGA